MLLLPSDILDSFGEKEPWSQSRIKALIELLLVHMGHWKKSSSRNLIIIHAIKDLRCAVNQHFTVVIGPLTEGNIEILLDALVFEEGDLCNPPGPASRNACPPVKGVVVSKINARFV